MSQMYGAVEFCELGEWNALINVGVLVVGNSQFNRLLFGARGIPHSLSKLARRGLPGELSVGFCAQYDPVRPHVHAETWATLTELEVQVDQWMRSAELAELLSDTNCLVVLELMRVLGGRFGNDSVRIVVFFD